MARLFDDAASDYLELASAPVTAAPLTMACWAFLDDSANPVDTLMCIGVNTANGHYFGMDVAGVVAGDPLRVSASNGAGGFSPSSINTTNAYTQWNHYCGVWTSATSRTAYFNGTAGTADTTSRTPSGVNTTRIGVLLYEGGATTQNPTSGNIAECAIWNVALTQAEITALAVDRVSPRNIRPNALVFHSSLVRELINSRGNPLTASGTTVSAHPLIYKLYRKLGGIFKIAAGGGTTTPVSLAATLSLTPAFIKEVGKITTATTVAIAGTVLSVGKTLAASVTLTPTLVVIRVTLVALAATLSLTPILIKQIGKNVAAGVTATPAFVRQMGLSLAATTISVAGSVMSVGKTLGTTVTLTAGLTLSLVATAIALAATVTLSAAMTLVTTVAPAVVRPFTGFAGLGWVGKAGWYARERRWRPRK